MEGVGSHPPLPECSRRRGRASGLKRSQASSSIAVCLTLVFVCVGCDGKASGGSPVAGGAGASGGASGTAGTTGGAGPGGTSGDGGSGAGGSDGGGGGSGAGGSDGGSSGSSGSGGSDGGTGGSGGAGGSDGGAGGSDGGAGGSDGGAGGGGGDAGCVPSLPSERELEALAADIAANVVEPGDPGAVEVELDVRAAEEMRAISPFIYGVNGGSDHERNRFGLVRSGGNRLTAYNWENNASNAGSDYFFQNDGYLAESDEPAVAVLPLLEFCQGALITLPIVDYVAADKNGGGDVRNSGPDYLMTRFKQNRAKKDGPLEPVPDPNDAFVYQDEFVSFLKNAEPKGPVLFSLDNEPDLWSETHAEVHPEKVTYAELWERNQRFASAAKDAWPEARVTGFVSYGFNGYVTLQDASDAVGRDFIEWYLDQAAAAEASGGRRLIDFLDLHWYPEARGGGVRITGTETDEAVVEARLQAPRSLFDPGYIETSWIVDYLGGAPIALLPRLAQKIDEHYPGTRLAFTEWNYGAGQDVSGALAVADVLGVFGRYGVGLAAYWALHSDESFAYAAFRAYRNFDGAGAAFGNVSIHAGSTDPARVTVHASLDFAAPERVVVIVVNKAAEATSAALRIAHSVGYPTARVFVLDARASELVPADPIAASADNAFIVPLPARSVSVIVPEG